MATVSKNVIGWIDTIPTVKTHHYIVDERGNCVSLEGGITKALEEIEKLKSK